MSLWRKRATTGFPGTAIIPRRGSALDPMYSVETAMHNSAVWACLRLRAGLLASFRLNIFRQIGDLAVKVPAPMVLTIPGGPRVGIKEWLYSSQVDLDRFGNCFGIISARDGQGLPARIDLVPAGDVTVVIEKGQLAKYRIKQTSYDPFEVWHEKQYPTAGSPVGLSPIMYAAWTLSEYQSIQQFALDWFANGTMPAATLKNTAKTVPPALAREVKDRFRASVDNGDVFVHGADWEFSMLNSQAAASQWLEGKHVGLVDIARFFGCPADSIDASIKGQSVTYANLSERQLTLLINHLGPLIDWREDAFSRGLLPAPRVARFDPSTLMRLDTQTQSVVLGQQIRDRIKTPSEARAFYDLPPFTAEQLAEFVALFGPPMASPPEPAPKEAAAPLMPNITIPINMPVLEQAPIRVLNEVRVPAALPAPAPIVNVNVPETTVRIVEETVDA